MALNFSFKNVADYEAVTTHPQDDESWHPVADALVWLSLICGFNNITQRNHAKIARRIAVYQQLTGSYLSRTVNNHRTPIYITPRDVERFIGMHTNASPLTDAQWLKKLGQIAMDARTDADRQEHTALEMVDAIAKAA